jgi:hypothetical protein
MQTMPALSDGSEAAGADRKSQRWVCVCGRERQAEREKIIERWIGRVSVYFVVGLGPSDETLTGQPALAVTPGRGFVRCDEEGGAWPSCLDERNY